MKKARFSLAVHAQERLFFTFVFFEVVSKLSEVILSKKRHQNTLLAVALLDRVAQYGSIPLTQSRIQGQCPMSTKKVTEPKILDIGHRGSCVYSKLSSPRTTTFQHLKWTPLGFSHPTSWGRIPSRIPLYLYTEKKIGVKMLLRKKLTNVSTVKRAISDQVGRKNG